MGEITTVGIDLANNDVIVHDMEAGPYPGRVRRSTLLMQKIL